MPSLRRTPNKPAGRSAKAAPAKAPRGARAKQIRTAFTMTKAGDPKLVPLLLAAFLGPFALLLALGFVLGHPIYLGILGLLVALVVTVAVFGRRVQKTAYSQVEGQLGAGAAVLQNMRGDWRVTPAVGFSREQDLVHRVLGRPGIVLVGEGSPNRVRGLIINEKKKLARWIGDTPVYDVVVGEGEGTVGLRELEKHFLKLPRNIKPVVVNELDRKLKAMPAAQLPVPKGPMPTRVPRGRR
ncbi:MAG: DUF4191 domain-containing protein [Actinobacteria bacterium]|nr:DUF4191 domain-containing protein [Actinomycetota bacterium]MCA1719628.1 DUF4191 domain-containing protein [Actinomycetota bacterium]